MLPIQDLHIIFLKIHIHLPNGIKWLTCDHWSLYQLIGIHTQPENDIIKEIIKSNAYDPLCMFSNWNIEDRFGFLVVRHAI